MRLPCLPPHEILQHLLESSETQQANFVEVIGSDRELISALVNGQQTISLEQAKKLGLYFKVAPSLFIES